MQNYKKYPENVDKGIIKKPEYFAYSGCDKRKNYFNYYSLFQ